MTKPCPCSMQHVVGTGTYRADGLLHRSFCCTACKATWSISWPDRYALVDDPK